MTGQISPSGTEPWLTGEDYERFAALIEERAGLYFSENRRLELEHGLRQAYAASTCADLDTYYRLLQRAGDGALEMDRLVNALTVGETYFFRDAGQFDALQAHVLPQIIERRRAIQTLRVWSAGCASGEEPYSLAMLIRELLPDVDEWAITILGTDVNTEALDRARKGMYGEWAFREEQAKRRRARFFRTAGSRCELVPEVRRMVTFARLNLAADDYPALATNTTMIDLILCRNVTIYFGEAATRAVTERLYGALAEGGWLVVGHSEASPLAYGQFKACNFPNAVLYQRCDQPAVRPAELRQLLPAVDVVPWSAPPPVPVAPPPALVAPPRPAEEGDPLSRAEELLAFGRSEQARDLLRQVTADRPRYAPAHALLGLAYANLGRWPDAERACRQAIHLDRLALGAYYTLALVLQHQGRLDEAIDAMKKVVYIDRNYVLGHFGLADLYHSKAQLAQAQKALDNARRLLEARGSDEIIPGSGGITTGRLQETIVHQQQQWTSHMQGT